jgi:hypothetical protein
MLLVLLPSLDYHTDCIYFLKKKLLYFFYQLNLEKIGKN